MVYRNRIRVPLVPWASRYKEIVTASIYEVYKVPDIYVDVTRLDQPIRYALNADQLFDSVEVKDRAGKLIEVLRPSNRVVVRGQTGSGKTTFLLKLAMDWANKESSLFHEDDAVFLLQLKKIADSSDLGDIIIDQLLSRKDFDCKSIEKFIENNQKRVIFLLDGWDEFKKTKSYERFVQLLSRKYLPDARVLITTRPGKLNNFLELVRYEKDEYRSLKISGFSTSKVDEYVRNALAEMPTQAETLLNYLTNNHLKEELACLPLMCSVLCQLAKVIEKEHFAEMRTITSLLDKIIDFLMDYRPRSNEEMCYGAQAIFLAEKHTPGSPSVLEIERHQTNMQNSKSSSENKNFLLELGNVALNRFTRSNEKELTFAYSDFHQDKPLAEEIVSKGCEIGILSKDYYELKTVADVTSREDEEPSIRFALKIFQEKLAAMYLVHLWVCGGEYKNRFKEFLLNICASYQRATDLGYVLMFSCGNSSDIAKEIIAKVVGLLSAQKDELNNFISGKLHHERWQEVQRMIELCLRLYYESPSNEAFDCFMLPLLGDSFCVRLVGFSAALSKYLGYFLAHMDGQYIKSVELRHLHSSSELSFKSYLDTFKEIKIAFTKSIARTRETKSKYVENVPENKRRWKLYGEEQKSDQIPQHLLMRMGDEVFNAVLPLWQQVNRKQLRAGSIGPVIDGLNCMKNCSIEEIFLDGVHCNNEDWKRFFSFMLHGAWTSLKRLSIINTHLQATLMSNLAHALGTHPNLVHLDLSGNHIDSEFLDSLSVCLVAGKLETLILQEVEMDSFSLKKLGKLVRNIPSLRIFDIKWNTEMNDEALYVIGDSLKKCTKLERLTISLYDVTKYGYKQVIEMDHFYRLVEIHFADSAKPEELLICITRIMPSMEKVQVVRISGTTGTNSKVSSHWVTSRAADLFSNAISKTPSLKWLSVLYIKFPSQSFINLLERCTEAKQSGLLGVW